MIQMGENSIIFKGTRDGLQISLGDDLTFDSLKDGLRKRLQQAGDFFKGTGLTVQFTGRLLEPDEISQLKNLIEEEIEAPVSVKDPPDDIKLKNFLENDDLIIEGPAKFIYNTIRSGQRIAYDGNIIVIGDVNPGAEVVAGGNIVVAGYIRGMTHAGLDGNDKAVIIAGSIKALQIRIGHLIARAPDNDAAPFSQPEIAYVSGSEIVIEPYLKAASIGRRRGEGYI